ncbi:hypothetical protein AX16_010313 [Volvariella volvacea WC 439]|nr:hypothetical protein AX16_010313 [Volvariella volvacea WC 439]
MAHGPYNLSPELLLKIPKLDKDEIITSYLQDQRSSSRAVCPSPKLSPLTSNAYSRNVSTAAYGFQTPLKLQSRAEKKLAGTGPSVGKAKESQSALRDTSRQKKVKKATKADQGHAGKTEEQALRLKERRERKRQRREIMKLSKRNTDSEDEQPRQRVQAKVPTGLALIHGFTPKNIGTSRLTIKPSAVAVGVFNKGKASALTRSVQKKDTIYFSEGKFLKCVTAKRQEQDSRRFGEDEEKTNKENPPSPELKFRATSKTQMKSKDEDNAEALSSSSSDSKYTSPDSSRQSAAWDIEQDVTPSEVHSIIMKTKSSAKTDQGGCARLSLACQGQEDGSSERVVDGSITPDARTENQEMTGHAWSRSSSPSLGPSQSASQTPKELQGRELTSSKYFPAGRNAYTLATLPPYTQISHQTFGYRGPPIESQQSFVEEPYPTTHSWCTNECPLRSVAEFCTPFHSGALDVSVEQEMSWGTFQCGDAGTTWLDWLPDADPIPFKDLEWAYNPHSQPVDYESEGQTPGDDLLKEDILRDLPIRKLPNCESEYRLFRSDELEAGDIGLDTSMNLVEEVNMGNESILSSSRIHSESELTPYAFSQGRALLMGVGAGELKDQRGVSGISSVEFDVARKLTSHWLPQKCHARATSHSATLTIRIPTLRWSVYKQMRVKPEPQEVGPLEKLVRGFGLDTSLQNAQNVKQEPVHRATLTDDLTGPSALSTHPKLEYPLLEATLQAPPVVPLRFRQFNSHQEIVYTPEQALNEGLEMVRALSQSLDNAQLASNLRQEVWKRDIESLLNQGNPTTLVAVCGATGAGKSSVLNAILDDNIVPTSGMQACTAVVTEVAYHKKPTIDADVSFLTVDEWKQELAVLLHDLVDDEGKIRRTSDLKSDAGIAWHKVHAVYPSIAQEQLVTMSVDEIIARDPVIATMLGTTMNIVSKDSKAFAQEIAKYIDSKDQRREKKGKHKKKDKAKKPESNEPALWPLIRQVNVRCRAKALSTGAVLVDLPGVADANAARDSIAKEYMKKCNCIWILAPITRAVDDKTARDLLGDAFKLQLMNGNYDSHAITFIATKCDDISCSELINHLGLDGDPEFERIEERLDELDQEESEWKDKKASAVRTIAEIDGKTADARARLAEHQAHLDALKNGKSFRPTLRPPSSKKRKGSKGRQQRASKRKRGSDDDDVSEALYSSDSSSDSNDTHCTSEIGDTTDSSDSSDSNDEMEVEDGLEVVSEESLNQQIDREEEAIKRLREGRKKAKDQKRKASDELANLKGEIAKMQKEKNAFCSLKRSEKSREILKEDFRTGLKDLDETVAERRDPENFDPSARLRDYDAIDLPVFTVSSRDYVRLKGQVKGDGEPSCFVNVNDTGIPDLQRWCQNLTVASRERSIQNFLTRLKTFGATIKSYFDDNSQVTFQDRDILRKLWESGPGLRANKLGVYQNALGSFASQYEGAYAVGPTADRSRGIANRLDTEFNHLTQASINGLKSHFKDGLEDKCRIGAINAANEALSTSDEFAAMHWATYRATLRRHGSWRRDLNIELVNPFTRSIAHSWGKVFESDLFSTFESRIQEVLKALVCEIESSAPPSLKDRAKAQGELCLEESVAGLKRTLHLAREALASQQKEASRSMAPHIQAQLREGYDLAMQERGEGSVARQRAVFKNYISNCKDEIFEDGADVLMGRLDEAAEAIGTTIDTCLRETAEKVEVSMSALWENTRESPSQVMARYGLLKVVDIVGKQVNMWLQAQKESRTQADHSTS